MNNELVRNAKVTINAREAVVKSFWRDDVMDCVMVVVRYTGSLGSLILTAEEFKSGVAA